jgi:hypothetical protein
MASGTEKEKLLGYFLPFPLDEGWSESRIDSDLGQANLVCCCSRRL